jgi:hypothetical protein
MRKYFTIFCTLFLFSCHSAIDKKDSDTSKSNSTFAKVEIYNFHQTKRCKACLAVGEQVKQFVIDNYGNNDNKDVLFRDVNISLKENQTIADKFQVNWSGLYILAHTSKGDVTENLTEFAFMNAVDKPDSVRKALESKINKYLNL